VLNYLIWIADIRNLVYKLYRCLHQVAIPLKSQNSYDGDGEKEEKYEGDNNNNKKLTATTTLHNRL